MKLCRVNIPFVDKETGELHKPNDEIKMTDKRINEVRSVNVNMVSVLGEAVEVAPAKPKKPRAKAKE